MELTTREFKDMLEESLRNSRDDSKKFWCSLLGISKDEADSLSRDQVLERAIGIGIREGWSGEDLMFELGYNLGKENAGDYDGSS